MQQQSFKLTGIQKKVAENLTKSKNKIPHGTTIREINMDNILKSRSKMNKKRNNASNISIVTFIIKSVINAMNKYPIFNSIYDEKQKEVIIKGKINIGIATAMGQNLVVPVIKDIENLSLEEIDKKVKLLRERAKTKKLGPNDFKEGSFTISNSGALGGEMFIPIINYPENALLGFGKIQKKPIVEENEEIVVASMMYACLSYDHRVINGREAVSFLGEIEDYCINFTI